MGTHRVTRKRITRSDGDVFEAGDEIDPTDAELRAFGDRLTEVEDGDGGDDDVEDEDDEVDERAVELANQNYQETIDAVRSGEADEFLDDLAEEDDRSTVQDAIEARQGE